VAVLRHSFILNTHDKTIIYQTASRPPHNLGANIDDGYRHQS
jgi:hypothetical protein